MTVPEGMMVNKLGHFVPVEQIDEIDLARDEFVLEVAERAEALSEQMRGFRRKVLDDTSAFVELSKEKYGVKLGGKKGNITLFSYSGLYKLSISISDKINFDERLQAAKELIDECILDWMEGSNSKLKALVDQAFQVDKQGNINTGRILALRSYKIDDAKWKRAMNAISDSIHVVSSRAYPRVYKRDEHGEYQLIVLNVAGA